MTKLRELFYRLILICGAVLVALTGAEYTAAWYLKRLAGSEIMQPGLLRYDPRLGWRLNANWEGDHEHHDYRARYRINAQGFRGRSVAELHPGAKVAVLGDSFTFGLGVNEGESFVARLNTKSGDRVQLLNYAVPGYSTDQALLLLEQTVLPRAPDRVVLVVYLGNDILDNALDYALQSPLAKPRFDVRDGVLIEPATEVAREPRPPAMATQTLAEIAFGDALDRNASRLRDRIARTALGRLAGVTFTPLDNAEAILSQRLQTQLVLFERLLERAAARASAAGATFQLVLLGGRSLASNPHGNAAQMQTFLGEAVTAIGTRHGITVHQPTQGLAGTHYYPVDGHFRPSGHAYVADALLATGLLAPWCCINTSPDRL